MEKKENIWKGIFFCGEMKNGEGKRRKNGEGKIVVGQTDVSDFMDYLPRYHVTDLISEQNSDFCFGH